VPGGEDQVEDRERGTWRRDAAGDGRDGAEGERRTEHPARGAEQQQRRRDDGEHEVLHHVPREQVVVADVVQGPVEREEHRREPCAEAHLLGPRETLGRIPPPVHRRAPPVERPEREQPRDRAPVHGEAALRQVDVRVEEESGGRHVVTGRGYRGI
jgi:hypothetical protein